MLAILAMASVAGAQTSNGTLVGAVTDQTGAVIPNVEVKVVSPQFGETHEATTDSVGTYRLDGLQPGIYSVTFTAPGLAALRVGSVTISGSVTTTVDGHLQLGSIQTTVTVEAGAAQVIDTQSGQLAGNISETEVTSLPYGTFNPAELALTLPGVQDVSPAAQIFEGVTFSVNGTRPHANNFLIDGQDDNDFGISGQAYQPDNVGAIQEVTVLTDSYSAEFGRGGGSVLNYIYRSGTNSFHGSAWEINQNSDFGSNPAENKLIPLPRPFFNENTYGFGIGGPVFKDKLFFFASAQWNPTAERATGDTLRIPTAAGISTLQGLDNANANLFIQSLGGLVAPSTPVDPKCLLLGSAPGSNVDRGCVATDLFAQNGVPVGGKDTSQYYRLDYHPTENDSISAAYIRNDGATSPDFFANPSALPPFITEQGGSSQIFHAQWVHTVSTNIVNELRYSYTDINFAFAPTATTLSGPLANLPNLLFDSDLTTSGPVGATLELGIDSGFPQGRAHKTSQVQEALTYSRGRHTFKGGVDITFVNVKDAIPFNSRGSIQYKAGGNFSDLTASGKYSSLANFIDDFTGNSGDISKVFGNPNVAPSDTLYMPYITDTFRARDNLTFTLGLRYEYWGTPSNVLPFPATDTSLGFGLVGAVFPNMYAFHQQPDRNNFAPRLGFAYTPKWGKRFFGTQTVIRGGYGIYYDGLYTNIPDNTAASVPNANGGDIIGSPSALTRGQANALEQLSNVTPILDPFAIPFTVSNKLVNPYTQQWNLNVQRELPGKLILTTAYVGSKGEKLFASQDYNGAVGLDEGGNFVRINPNFNEIVVRTNAGASWYNAAEVELERSLNADFVLRASYTYSHFTDDTSEPVALLTGGSSFSEILNSQKSDWGNSAYDRRHRLVISYVWNLPYSKSNWLMKALTDRWQWSQITTFDSGTPDTVYDGLEINLDGHSANDRPFLGNKKLPFTDNGIDGSWIGFPTGDFYSLPDCVFGTGACTPEPASNFHFVVPAQTLGLNGNTPRNSHYGPGQVYSDQSIERRFPIPMGKLEHQSITFRAEFFNAFNHPNFFTPHYNLTDGNFNDVASTITGSRAIKFWLKYEF
ncbi:MAG: TonB-dependent receptor [Candidatus Acidiferrales bacterium]